MITRNVIKEFVVGVGMNDRFRPVNLPPNRCVRAYNYRFTSDGALVTRPGSVLWKTLTGAAGICHGIYQYEANNQPKVVITHGTNLYVTDSADPVSIAPVATALPNTDTDYTQIKSQGVQLGIVAYPGNPMMKWNGTTFTALGGAPPNADYVATFKQQVVCVPSADPTTIRVSGIDNAESWNSIDTYTTDSSSGQRIRGLINYYDKLLIVTDENFWALSGNNRSDFRLEPVYSRIGIAARHSLQVMNNLVIGLSFDRRVYAYDSNRHWDASYDIPATIGDISLASIGKAWSARRVDGQFNEYWLAIPASGAGQNDTLLVANFDMFESVPGADGPQPAWSVWSGQNIKCYAVSQVFGSSQRERIALSGDDTNTILRRDVPLAVTDNAVNYDSDFTGREQGSLTRARRLRRLVFSMNTSAGTASMNVQLRTNQGGVQTNVQTLSSSGSTGGAKWNVGKWDVDKWGGPSAEYIPIAPDAAQGPGYTWSLKISQSPVLTLTEVQRVASVEDELDPYTSGEGV